MIDAYRASHPNCFRCGQKRDHIHHLFKGHRSRVDHPANIIAVCWRCHGLDDSEPVAFKVECLDWKLRRGELDVESLSRISGEQLAGWLDRHRPGACAPELRVQWLRLSEECRRV